MASSQPRARASVDLLFVEKGGVESLSIARLMPSGPGALAETWSVEGVEEALRFLQQKRFDALVLDLDGEEDRGIEALVRAQVVTESLPVIVVSDDDDETLGLRALRLGAQDYIVKSEASRHVVTRTVLHAIERHRLLRDLTEARRREHFLATHDALTELPNRFFLQDFLARGIESARRRKLSVAVLFIDLDGFKAVNDTLGHPAGDELLRQTSRRLETCVRREDLVSRLGGDEFVLALPGVESVDDAISTARKVSEQLVMPYDIGGKPCWVTPSIGVALFPEDAPDADALVRYADLAMYEAKRRGSNQIRLHRQGSEDSRGERFALVNELRGAIARGELFVHFQPQVEIQTGRAVAVEALPRWRHAQEGWVSPGTFIPIAERSGMLAPLGDWVLRTACEAALGWEGELAVAVNVSPIQLSDPDFGVRSLRILDQSGLPAERLELEIVESSAAGTEENVVGNLSLLRERGVRIVLDDFGTGASSMSLLRSLPVDTVKLDESLVHGLPDDPRDRVIVGGLTQMVRGLGMEFVAEGVETLEQLRRVDELGCRRAQGYLLAKPIPEEDVAGVLAEEPWREELERLSG